ncbi:MAG: N-acetylglucosamine-6-phosphate deacetylase [Spirochaetota bacterium]
MEIGREEGMEYKGLDPLSGNILAVRVREGRIDSVEAMDAPASTRMGESSLPYLCRGFLDMQVNGYMGSDYSLEDFSRDHLEKIVAHMARSGTSCHIPTIVTRPRDLLLRNLEIIREARKSSPVLAAAIPGVHIEGPYISSEDGPRGAHDPAFVRDPRFEEFLEWQEASGGLVHMVTIAPEREGALEFTRKLTALGVVVALGHTAATPEQIRQAVAAGAKVSTHLGNGSHASIPRLRNYIWEQLATDELAASLIADGFHLPETVMKVFTRAKGLDRLVLVSDAALLGGYSPGIYSWGNLKVEVFPDGHIGLPGTTFLAGAAHLLDWDIPVFMRATGATLGETIRLCTENPARLLGLDSEASGFQKPGAPKSPGLGLAPGSAANLVFFRHSPGMQRLEIGTCVVGGQAMGRSLSRSP